jgi:hypothetical protein
MTKIQKHINDNQVEVEKALQSSWERVKGVVWRGGKPGLVDKVPKDLNVVGNIPTTAGGVTGSLLRDVGRSLTGRNRPEFVHGVTDPLTGMLPARGAQDILRLGGQRGMGAGVGAWEESK